jgi:hypothetical protein
LVLDQYQFRHQKEHRFEMAAVELILPSHSKTAIEEVVKGEKLHDFTLIVTAGSSSGDNYLGDIYRIVIIGKRECGTEASFKVILKSCPSNEELRKTIRVDLIYRREILMYSTFLPKLDQFQACIEDGDRFHFAKLYRGNCDSGNELLIMEDLGEKGFITHDRLKPLDYDHLSMIMKNLARFHAASFALKAKYPDLYKVICEARAKFSDFGESADTIMDKFKPGIKKILDGQPYEEKVEFLLENCTEEYKIFFNPELSQPYDVICHGDCWTNNFLFKYKVGGISMFF